MKLPALLLALLSWLPAAAQTSVPIVNGSFELAPPTAPYDYITPLNPLPGWTCTTLGYKGRLVPTASQIAAVPDGKVVLWLQSMGACIQDLGAAPAVNKLYTLTFNVGSQSNFPIPTVYSANLLIGTTPITGCSAGGSPIKTPGILVQQSLACTTGATIPTGNLVVSLSSGANQTIFDNITLTSAPAGPPQFVTFKFGVQLLTCTKCDSSDDNTSPALGLLAGSMVSIGNGNVVLCSANLNSTASMSCSASIDISPPLIPLSLTITSPDGTIGYNDSQQVLGLLFTGRSVVNITGLFDAVSLQPRGMRAFIQ
jgi:hypothetical protein